MVEEIHNLSCVIYPYLGSSPPPATPRTAVIGPFSVRENSRS